MFLLNPAALTHGIQLAIAPVFLLTAVASLINAVATRLARIIDRARVLEERLEAQTIKNVEAAYLELDRLKLRGRLVNWAMALLTVCSMLIGVTIMALFLGETTALHTLGMVPASFLSGVLGFVLALICFLAETLLATRVLHFGKHIPRE
jgi:hypothetical protein